MLAENVCPTQLSNVSFYRYFGASNIPCRSFKQQDAFLNGHAEETNLFTFHGVLGFVSLSSESSETIR